MMRRSALPKNAIPNTKIKYKINNQKGSRNVVRIQLFIIKDTSKNIANAMYPLTQSIGRYKIRNLILILLTTELVKKSIV